MRTGKCWLCGAPSNPNGIGGRLERCEECKKKQARARRAKWSEANKEREDEMKRAWQAANKERKEETRREWNKRNRDHVNESGKAWKKKNPEAMRKYRFKKYGLTVEQYDAMFAAQGGKCAICGTTTPRADVADFCVDHDHETGAVRGLLCFACNAGIGQMQDSTRILLSAVDYLIQHGSPGLLPER